MLILPLLFLSACSSVKNFDAEYAQLSCDELKNEYKSVLQAKVQAFNSRMGANDVNVAVGALSGALTGFSQTQSLGKSISEHEMDLRMASIRKLMKDKCCECKGCKK